MVLNQPMDCVIKPETWRLSYQWRRRINVKSLNFEQVKALNQILGIKFYLDDNDLVLISEDGHCPKVCINIDRTETEALHNHLHFDRFFSKDVSKTEKDKFTQIMMEMLYLRLKRAFPQRLFRIYVENDRDCLTLRFTQIQPEEENWANECDFANEINAGTFCILSD